MNLLSCPHSSLLCIKHPHNSLFSSHPKVTKLPLSLTSKPTPIKPSAYVDEWGEKSTPDQEPTTRFPDPRGDDDEWGAAGNGVPPVDEESVEDEELKALKKALVDTVYGTDSGFGASSEVRAEALSLQKLEAANLPKAY
ncbi:hypothetical protein Leryth_015152 [Lithospermum erythrorhizon]|nr:hypothetical protein Leryth_015152 [Lithospermum erythrorhizon]